jgi:hypothetical protein
MRRAALTEVIDPIDRIAPIDPADLTAARIAGQIAALGRAPAAVPIAALAPTRGTTAHPSARHAAQPRAAAGRPVSPTEAAHVATTAPASINAGLPTALRVLAPAAR